MISLMISSSIPTLWIVLLAAVLLTLPPYTSTARFTTPSTCAQFNVPPAVVNINSIDSRNATVQSCADSCFTQQPPLDRAAMSATVQAGSIIILCGCFTANSLATVTPPNGQTCGTVCSQDRNACGSLANENLWSIYSLQADPVIAPPPRTGGQQSANGGPNVAVIAGVAALIAALGGVGFFLYRRRSSRGAVAATKRSDSQKTLLPTDSGSENGGQGQRSLESQRPQARDEESQPGPKMRTSAVAASAVSAVGSRAVRDRQSSLSSQRPIANAKKQSMGPNSRANSTAGNVQNVRPSIGAKGTQGVGSLNPAASTTGSGLSPPKSAYNSNAVGIALIPMAPSSNLTRSEPSVQRQQLQTLQNAFGRKSVAPSSSVPIPVPAPKTASHSRNDSGLGSSLERRVEDDRAVANTTPMPPPRLQSNDNPSARHQQSAPRRLPSQSKQRAPNQAPILQAPPRTKRNMESPGSGSNTSPTVPGSSFPPQGPPPNTQLPNMASPAAQKQSLEQRPSAEPVRRDKSLSGTMGIPPPTRPAPSQPPVADDGQNTLVSGIDLSKLPEIKMGQEEEWIMAVFATLKKNEAVNGVQNPALDTEDRGISNAAELQRKGTGNSVTMGMSKPAMQYTQANMSNSNVGVDGRSLHNPQAALEALLKIELPPKRERRPSTPPSSPAVQKQVFTGGGYAPPSIVARVDMSGAPAEHEGAPHSKTGEEQLLRNLLASAPAPLAKDRAQEVTSAVVVPPRKSETPVQEPAQILAPAPIERSVPASNQQYYPEERMAAQNTTQDSYRAVAVSQPERENVFSSSQQTKSSPTQYSPSNSRSPPIVQPRGLPVRDDRETAAIPDKKSQYALNERPLPPIRSESTAQSPSPSRTFALPSSYPVPPQLAPPTRNPPVPPPNNGQDNSSERPGIRFDAKTNLSGVRRPVTARQSSLVNVARTYDSAGSNSAMDRPVSNVRAGRESSLSHYRDTMVAAGGDAKFQRSQGRNSNMPENRARNPVLSAYAVGRQAAVPRQFGPGRDGAYASRMSSFKSGTPSSERDVSSETSGPMENSQYPDRRMNAQNDQQQRQTPQRIVERKSSLAAPARRNMPQDQLPTPPRSRSNSSRPEQEKPQQQQSRSDGVSQDLADQDSSDTLESSITTIVPPSFSPRAEQPSNNSSQPFIGQSESPKLSQFSLAPPMRNPPPPPASTSLPVPPQRRLPINDAMNVPSATQPRQRLLAERLAEQQSVDEQSLSYGSSPKIMSPPVGNNDGARQFVPGNDLPKTRTQDLSTQFDKPEMQSDDQQKSIDTSAISAKFASAPAMEDFGSALPESPKEEPPLAMDTRADAKITETEAVAAMTYPTSAGRSVAYSVSMSPVTPVAEDEDLSRAARDVEVQGDSSKPTPAIIRPDEQTPKVTLSERNVMDVIEDDDYDDDFDPTRESFFGPSRPVVESDDEAEKDKDLSPVDEREAEQQFDITDTIDEEMNSEIARVKAMAMEMMRRDEEEAAQNTISGPSYFNQAASSARSPSIEDDEPAEQSTFMNTMDASMIAEAARLKAEAMNMPALDEQAEADRDILPMNEKDNDAESTNSRNEDLEDRSMFMDTMDASMIAEVARVKAEAMEMMRREEEDNRSETGSNDQDVMAETSFFPESVDLETNADVSGEQIEATGLMRPDRIDETRREILSPALTEADRTDVDSEQGDEMGEKSFFNDTMDEEMHADIARVKAEAMEMLRRDEEEAAPRDVVAIDYEVNASPDPSTANRSLITDTMDEEMNAEIARVKAEALEMMRQDEELATQREPTSPNAASESDSIGYFGRHEDSDDRSLMLDTIDAEMNAEFARVRAEAMEMMRQDEEEAKRQISLTKESAEERADNESEDGDVEQSFFAETMDEEMNADVARVKAEALEMMRRDEEAAALREIVPSIDVQDVLTDNESVSHTSDAVDRSLMMDTMDEEMNAEIARVKAEAMEMIRRDEEDAALCVPISADEEDVQSDNAEDTPENRSLMTDTMDEELNAEIARVKAEAMEMMRRDEEAAALRETLASTESRDVETESVGPTSGDVGRSLMMDTMDEEMNAEIARVKAEAMEMMRRDEEAAAALLEMPPSSDEENERTNAQSTGQDRSLARENMGQDVIEPPSKVSDVMHVGTEAGINYDHSVSLASANTEALDDEDYRSENSGSVVVFEEDVPKDFAPVDNFNQVETRTTVNIPAILVSTDGQQDEQKSVKSDTDANEMVSDHDETISPTSVHSNRQSQELLMGAFNFEPLVQDLSITTLANERPTTPEELKGDSDAETDMEEAGQASPGNGFFRMTSSADYDTQTEDGGLSSNTNDLELAYNYPNENDAASVDEEPVNSNLARSMSADNSSVQDPDVNASDTESNDTVGLADEASVGSDDEFELEKHALDIDQGEIGSPVTETEDFTKSPTEPQTASPTALNQSTIYTASQDPLAKDSVTDSVSPSVPVQNYDLAHGLYDENVPAIGEEEKSAMRSTVTFAPILEVAFPNDLTLANDDSSGSVRYDLSLEEDDSSNDKIEVSEEDLVATEPENQSFVNDAVDQSLRYDVSMNEETNQELARLKKEAQALMSAPMDILPEDNASETVADDQEIEAESPVVTRDIDMSMDEDHAELMRLKREAEQLMLLDDNAGNSQPATGPTQERRPPSSRISKLPMPSAESSAPAAASSGWGMGGMVSRLWGATTTTNEAPAAVDATPEATSSEATPPAPIAKDIPADAELKSNNSVSTPEAVPPTAPVASDDGDDDLEFVVEALNQTIMSAQMVRNEGALDKDIARTLISSLKSRIQLVDSLIVRPEAMDRLMELSTLKLQIRTEIEEVGDAAGIDSDEVRPDESPVLEESTDKNVMKAARKSMILAGEKVKNVRRTLLIEENESFL
ncbi:hypothetical protein DFS34DRAFT_418651 [Phlyctochytrium arcticum]|nr:hypothetical protein DFS34DRAFT_418651 [Phlyctochytrium arcticum]